MRGKRGDEGGEKGGEKGKERVVLFQGHSIQRNNMKEETFFVH
jgi:hypothetical protein